MFKGLCKTVLLGSLAKFQFGTAGCGHFPSRYGLHGDAGPLPGISSLWLPGRLLGEPSLALETVRFMGAAP